MDVEQHQAGVAVGIQRVELLMKVETRDARHGEELLTALRRRGLEVDRAG